MKVRITLTLDVDEKAWALEYGVSVNEVRKDVQTYVTEAVRADLIARELVNG